MARPAKEIDQKCFQKLCKLQCTLEEIAGFFECSIDTIERWCERTFNESFAEIYKKYSAGGRTSLRRYQFNLAKTNASMAIWLGKQYLGQTDKLELGQADEDKSLKIEMVAPSETDIERLKKIRENLFKSEN